MPAATESTRSDISDAVEQVTKLNERVFDTGKRVGIAYLDRCDKMVAAAFSAGRKTSEQPLEVARTLVEAQTDVASVVIVGRSSGSRRWRYVRSLIATRCSSWRLRARRIYWDLRRRRRAIST